LKRLQISKIQDFKAENVIAKLGVVANVVIPAIRRLRQEDHKFETNLGYKRKQGLGM
jgi:hypothetical protein